MRLRKDGLSHQPKHRPFITIDGRVLHPTKGFLPKSKRKSAQNV
jgi:hypothetical protein